jgi:glucokinase
MKKNVVIGIDLGGTNVRAGVVDTSGKLLAVEETPIQASQGPKAGLTRITMLIDEVLRQCGDTRLTGIGIGCTGPLDPDTGTIQNPYTLPTWENVPITDPLQKHYRVPVVLENDADAAALGEYWLGAGRRAHLLYAITVGTGIGTAFIQDGVVFRGLNHTHPEGGHIPLDPSGPECYCGSRGCWEILASGTAIDKRTREMVMKHPESAILQIAGGQLEKVNARVLMEAVRAGDIYARRVFDEVAQNFCLGLISVVNFFAPEVIVLSGGVMTNIDLFMPAIEQSIAKNNQMVPATSIKIIPASLGTQAGIFGAAYAIYRKLGEL